MDNMSKEIAVDLVKAAPPATVTGMSLYGIPLSEILVAATLLYTVLMVVSLARKLFLSFKRDVKDPACAEDCPVARRLLNNQQPKGRR